MLNLREIISHKTNLDVILTERNVMNTADIATFTDQLAQQANIEGAPEPFNQAVKKWFTSGFRNWIRDEFDGVQRLTAEQLPDNAPTWMVAGVNSADGLLHVDVTAQQLRDIANGALEYFSDNQTLNPQNVSRISVPAMLQHIEQMEQQRQQDEMAEQIQQHRLIEEPGTEVVYDYGDGWSWRRMTTRRNMKYETSITRVCLGNDVQPYMARMESGEGQYYSLRDPENKGKVSLEYFPRVQRMGQIRGNGNETAAPFKKQIADLMSVMRFNTTTDGRDGNTVRAVLPESEFKRQSDGTIVVPSVMSGDINGDVIMDETITMNRIQQVRKETTLSKNIETIGNGKSINIHGEFAIHSNDINKTYILNTPTLIVQQDCSLVDIQVKMPKAVAVGGNAFWSRAAFLTCPDAINVRGDLYFPRLVKGLPTKIKVGGTLFIPAAMADKLTPILEDDQKTKIY